jgi:tRNA threonylcarbamoyladenosine biosynthesis protein TsaB
LTPEPESPAPGGVLLAIDTSTLAAGLALYGDGGVLAELQWLAGRAQTSALLAEVERLLALAGLAVGELGAVATAIGPGSFNGLRVGMSAAKGLAFALGVPLIGIPTLDAAAYAHGGAGRPIRAVLAAGRGRLVSALYRWQDGATVRAGDYATTTLDGLAALIVEPTLVCGEVGAGEARRLMELAPLAQVVPPALGLRRAACLAELAWGRLRRGEVDDVDRLEPIYLHGPAGGGADAATEATQTAEPLAVE